MLWTSAFTHVLRGVLLEGVGHLSAVKWVEILLVQPSQHTKPHRFPISSTWGAVQSGDTALALPTLLNPRSPCQNLVSPPTRGNKDGRAPL